MKKATIATILSAVMLLTIAVPLHAEGSGGGQPVGWMPWFYEGSDTWTYFCTCPSGSETTCYCDYPGGIMSASDCTIDDVLDAYRSHDGYYGEDENYLYFTATISDPQTNTYSADANGTDMIGLDKSALEAWVNAGCPENFDF